MTPRLIVQDGALVARTGSPDAVSSDPASTPELAMTTEVVNLGDVDRVFATLAAVWSPALEVPSSDLDPATLWALLRTG